MRLPELKQRLLFSAVSLAFAALAILLIKKSAAQGLLSVSSFLAGGLTLGWIAASSHHWWLLMPVAVAFGGIFFYSHKLFPHEIALLICSLALLPVITLRRKELPDRPRLPGPFLGLLSLFIVNWAVSFYVSDSQDIRSLGSLSRAYLHGFWAVLFAALFYGYGILKPRLLLGVLYVVFLSRMLLAGVAFLFENVFAMPQAGFAAMSAILGVIDLRVTGLQMALLAFVFAKLAARNVWKTVNYGIMILAGILVALGGGRVSVGMIFAAPLIWCTIRRQFGLLAFVSALGLSLMLLLNQKPDLLYTLPLTAQRALSFLITETSTKWVDWHIYNVGSDYWHRYLGELGWQRWTQSPVTVLFGNRVAAYDEVYNAAYVTIEMKAEIASRLGYFESGLWNVLVLLGALGAFFYFRIFGFLLGHPYALIKKEGILTPAHALGYLAVILTALWALFCWTAGGFPSYELMMAVFAKVACSDEMERRERQDKSLN